MNREIRTNPARRRFEGGARRVAALVLIAAAVAVAAVARAQSPATPRQSLSADFDWKFTLGDPAGGEATTFDDASWRAVSLPHDWSIEGAPDPKNPTGSGGGYYPAGAGWYRKSFAAPAGWKGRRVSVEFDGVYRNATVYLNGHKLGTRPNGYSSFAYDLTPHLSFSSRNVLAVRVDNSAQPNSRWYSGSGIYRHVRVVVTDHTHVARWGVFVTTPEATAAKARVSVRTRVANEASAPASVTLRTTLTGPNGAPAGEAKSAVEAAPGVETEVVQDVTVASPALWSPRTPNLYRVVTQVLRNGRVIDEVVTPFGIRTIAWSTETGFVLNGEPVELFGGSVHHDNGPLGAAAFDRAEERRVELLKAAGFNAVRTAHNAPSSAFLDACDRLGLLVLDEPFDVWKTAKAKFDSAADFDEWWRRDVEALVLRDRNHPSVVMWGIGNEIQEVWTPQGAPIARRLAEHVRSLDGTRPLTQAFPGATYGANPDAAIAAVDIAGYNYNLAQNHAKDHERVPGRIMMTTESLPADAFEQWQLVQDKPHVVGEFVWTAMDYLGESGIGAWLYGTPAEAAQAEKILPLIKGRMATMGEDGKNPFPVQDGTPPNPATAPLMKFVFPGYPWHAAYCGDLDLTGFRKPQSYYRDILWNGGDRVYAAVRRPEPEGQKIIATLWGVYPTLPSWTWPGREGKNMEVEVYSGAEKVRLLLNDKLVGEMPTGREQQFKAVFTVPYAPGTLKAVGVNGERVVAESVLTTAGAPTQLRLMPDRAAVRADGQDLSFVVVEALDARGRFQPNADQEVEFAVGGPGVIAAVGSGDGKSDESYVGNRRRLLNGRALAVVRTSRTAGTIRLTAVAPGLTEATATIHAQAAEPRPEAR
jgi:beta-galactosidase